MSEHLSPIIQGRKAGLVEFFFYECQSVNIHLSLLLSSRQPILRRKINVVICDTVPWLDQVLGALCEAIDQTKWYFFTVLLHSARTVGEQERWEKSREKSSEW